MNMCGVYFEAAIAKSIAESRFSRFKGGRFLPKEISHSRGSPNLDEYHLNAIIHDDTRQMAGELT